MTRQPGERLYAPTRQYLAIHASAELITGCARTERVLGWWSRVAREDGTARRAHGLRTAAGAVPGRLRAVAGPAAGWLDHGGGRGGARGPETVAPQPSKPCHQPRQDRDRATTRHAGVGASPDRGRNPGRPDRGSERRRLR
ncbi:hypothetical protein GCM10010259_62760 [Streptomyces daghestanicus]|uniref:Uncharacterized protein n=1 Tax=Streptomyces daghestanicus TaxID=66885 RepID=A0ABQ3PYC0_9ACTN|nr:hypothetical protein GCM10010259_62760 [Streptomyces daghestanicus]GHI30027.1 hypothetical protein Sdagh_17570 [Streptomyces daghestanicus]